MTFNPDAEMTRGRCLQAFLPSTLAVCAITLGTAANFYCETVKFVQTEGNQDLSLYVSPWNYRTKDTYEWGDGTYIFTTCRSYSYLEDNFGFEYTVDAITRTVWSFSIVTPILGGVFILGACLGPCMTVRPSVWKSMGVIFVLLSAFQGITLLIQSSSICSYNPVLQYMESSNPDIAATLPESCELATGFLLNIAAVILWFLAGVSAIVFRAPVVVAEHPPQEQNVTYMQNPDGTIEEINVTVVKGKAVHAPNEASEA